MPLLDGSWLTQPWRLFFLLAGPFVGTYAATWAVAWPRLPRPLVGGSICARCGGAVPLRRQIPLVSWALAKGGRGCCEGRIPKAYPMGEAAGLAVGAACALFSADAAEAAMRFALGVTLIYASLVDIRRFVIPAQAIAVVAVLGVAEHVRLGDWEALRDGLIGAAGVMAVFEGVRRWSALRRGEPGLGAGDGLLAGALAVWVGWEMAPVMVGVAAMAALQVNCTKAREVGVTAFGWVLATFGFGTLVGS